MNLFQILLTILILLLIFLVNRSRAILFERILIFLITLGGGYFVIFPESASTIANMLGIGRGADLIFYLFIIFSLFWFASTSAKFQVIDRKLTEIIRANAISNPIEGNSVTDNGDRNEITING